MLEAAAQISNKVKSYLFSNGFKPNSSLEIAGSAGSSRCYYRVKEGEKSLIIQTNEAANEDFKNYAKFSSILLGIDVKVPKIFCKDTVAAQLVIEDFGSKSLFDEVAPCNDSRRASAFILYDHVISELIKMQVASGDVFNSYPEIARYRKFDYAALKWESEYFNENYVKKFLGREQGLPEHVVGALATIACAVDMQPRVLMHRDFQSQNIMLMDDASVGFIDFQGLRRGSQYYDLASLLWDPYVMLPLDMVEHFFRKWCKHYPGTSGYSDEELWGAFLAASLQRLMQALGAYCFLSQTKKIEKFAQYIAPGRARLIEVFKLYNEYSPSSNSVANQYLRDVLS